MSEIPWLRVGMHCGLGPTPKAHSWHDPPNMAMLDAFCHSSAPVSLETTEMNAGVCLMVSWSLRPHTTSTSGLKGTVWGGRGWRRETGGY